MGPRPVSRRSFDALLGSVLVAGPCIAVAQSLSAIRRIGFLDVASPGDYSRELVTDLRPLGWVEGKNLVVERRHASGLIAGLKSAAEDLVRSSVEVIVANGPNPTLAAMHATSTIPIVFVASDPVGSGLVASLSRPGGNVTGFSATGNEADAKVVSLLKEAIPTLRRVGKLETAGNPQFRLTRGPLEEACSAIGLEVVFIEVSTPSQIDGAIDSLKQQGVQVLLLAGDSFAYTNGPEIISAAIKSGIPTAVWEPALVRTANAFASYSASGTEVIRRLAYYVDRVLRGAKPGNLPVEQPTEFKLVINLKTARLLELNVPQSLLLRADEVIR